jgi:hypothetical protein
MSNAWKGLERRVCRALGGQRAGPMGRHHSDCTSDVPFAVEVKRSQRLGPPVLAKWIQQARRQSKQEHKPWLVVVAGHNDAHPIVAMEFDTFVEIARTAGWISLVPPAETDEVAL